MAALLRPLVILLLADELHGSGTSARQSSALAGTPSLSDQASAGTLNLYALMDETHLGFHPLHDAPYIAGVDVGIFLDHLYDVDDQKHRFEADFILDVGWYDTRDFSPLFDAATNAHTEDECPDSLPKSLELGIAEQALIWKPDLHVANVATESDAHHSIRWSKMRIFARKDGAHQVQITSYHWAVLVMALPQYFNFPFDVHHLPVNIESNAFSEERIRLSANEETTGVTEHTESWPGWLYVSHDMQGQASHPEAVDGNACYAKLLNRASIALTVEVKRSLGGYQKGTFMPTHLLIITSWSGFWLKHSALMPRIATAFISFLTLTSWTSNLLSVIPKVTYTVWLKVFMEFGRLFMLFALFETVVAHVIASTISTRTSIALDVFCRWFVPLNYFVITIILYLHRETSEDAALSENLLFIDLGFMIFCTIVYTVRAHFALRRGLRNDVLNEYMTSRVPLDSNELDYLYDLWDKDGNQSLTPEELVAGVLSHSKQAKPKGRRSSIKFEMPEDIDEARRAAAVKAVTMKAGAYLTREQFRAQIRPILAELCHQFVCEPRVQQKQEKGREGGETTDKFRKPSRSKVTPMEQETPAQHSEEAEDLDGEGKEDEVRPAHEL